MTDDTNVNPEEPVEAAADPVVDDGVVETPVTDDEIVDLTAEGAPAGETRPVAEEYIEPEPSEDGSTPFNAGPSRLDVLKERAKAMGISFSPNIGEKTLNDRIQARLAETEAAQEPEAVAATAGVAPRRRWKMPDIKVLLAMSQDEIADLPKQQREQVIRRIQKHEGMRLIRCQIYNNNPAKNDLKGEILSVQNKYLGTVRKFIPFGEATEGGYHVPKVLFDMLRERQYQRVKSVKNPDGTERVETTLAPEFTLVPLAPLTKAQLDELAAMQQSRNASVGFVGA